MEAFFSSLFGSFLSFLVVYKYWGLFVIAFISSLAIPIPASAALSAASAFASQGYLNIYGVFAVTLAGSIFGDFAGYFIARRYGEGVLRAIGFKRLLNSKAYHKVEDYISDFAGTLIFFSRFLTELSPAVNLLAGLSSVSYRTFFIFAILGETVYTLLYGLAGYFLGSAWQNNISFFVTGSLVIFSLGLVINTIQYLFYKRHRKHVEARGSRHHLEK